MSSENAVTSIKVRMYRQGFGDCFLLSFYSDDDRVFTMLIDCGIKYNQDAPIEEVIADLRANLTPEGEENPKLDVLVATHEHWDHIAYFHPTRFPNYFKDFEIGRVWLAWTEDPDDPEAKTINSRLREGAVALHLAAAQLEDAEKDEKKQSKDMRFGGEVADARSKFNQSMDDVLGFYGADLKDANAMKEQMFGAKEVSESGIRYKKKATISTMTEVSMKNIIAIGERGGGIKYFEPGETVDKRLVPKGVNVFVLGPPKSSLINKSNPSRGHAHETYLSIDRGGMSSFIDGLLGMGTGDASGGESITNPFGAKTGMVQDAAKKDPFFKETYFAKHEAYRRIEHNWLDIAGQFALQLDGAINNTSLVLAIEFAESGKVLLFPGDAQVGSWLSWHDQQWTFRRGSKTHTRTAEQLLNNTVLYKVAHHGSHNATIREKGLAMMTHPELVAMIPEKEKSYNGILYQPLMEELDKRCKGRVLVSADRDLKPESLLKGDKPAAISSSEWIEFKKDVQVKKLYVEYTIRG